MSRPAIRLLTVLAPLVFCAIGCSLTGRSPSQIASDDSESEVNNEKLPSEKLLGELAGVSLLGSATPKPERRPVGLYTMTPFNRDKIPVVLVHGVTSGAGGWEPMLSKLNSDSQIASNYQFWKFLYSTKNSFLLSASDLRASLSDAVNQLDPKRENPRLSHIVLIGHGIGGLLSKLQVTHSDDVLWDAVSDKPIEALAVEPDARKRMKETLYFDPQPMIGRVISIGGIDEPSLPSASGENQIGDRLKKLPRSIKDGYTRISGSEDKRLLDLKTGVPHSANQFSPDSPILTATGELRFAAGITVHSIISSASKIPAADLASGEDSRDLANGSAATSTWYVAASQSDLHQADQTIRQVRRLLTDHLPPSYSNTTSP